MWKSSIKIVTQATTKVIKVPKPSFVQKKVQKIKKEFHQ